MGFIAKAKSWFGSGTSDTMPVLEQTATPYISTSASSFTCTGTTAITGFSTNTPIQPGRHITIVGTHASGMAVTDTAIASTANGKIHLDDERGALTLLLGTNVTFIQNNNGSWSETGRGMCD